MKGEGASVAVASVVATEGEVVTEMVTQVTTTAGLKMTGAGDRALAVQDSNWPQGRSRCRLNQAPLRLNQNPQHRNPDPILSEGPDQSITSKFSQQEKLLKPRPRRRPRPTNQPRRQTQMRKLNPRKAGGRVEPVPVGRVVVRDTGVAATGTAIVIVTVPRVIVTRVVVTSGAGTVTALRVTVPSGAGTVTALRVIVTSGAGTATATLVTVMDEATATLVTVMDEAPAKLPGQRILDGA